MINDEEHTYSTHEVAAITGATYRQCDHWARTGRITGQPAGRGTGSGHRRRWTAAQIERVGQLLRASEVVNATLDEVVEMQANAG